MTEPLRELHPVLATRFSPLTFDTSHALDRAGHPFCLSMWEEPKL